MATDPALLQVLQELRSSNQGLLQSCSNSSSSLKSRDASTTQTYSYYNKPLSGLPLAAWAL